MDVTVSEIRRGYLHNLAAQHKRVDGRALDEYRHLEIEPGYLGTAEGSARVRLGTTDVVIGVKMSIGTPYPDSPTSGALSTGIDLRPVAAHHFELGPPRPPSIELSRVVDRGVRESRAIDMAALCVEPGAK